MDRKKYVIIMAAGSGTRMGADRPKQFLELDGKAVLQRTIEVFLEACPGISVVTVLPEDFIGCLQYMDTDSDGKIRVNDIVATAKWITSAIKNADLLLKGDDHIDIEQLNQEDANGKKLYISAKQILANLNKEGSVISLG